MFNYPWSNIPDVTFTCDSCQFKGVGGEDESDEGRRSAFAARFGAAADLPVSAAGFAFAASFESSPVFASAIPYVKNIDNVSAASFFIASLSCCEFRLNVPVSLRADPALEGRGRVLLSRHINVNIL